MALGTDALRVRQKQGNKTGFLCSDVLASSSGESPNTYTQDWSE